MNDEGNKSSRILSIYEQLINGHVVVADEVASKFNVCNRTVHRDIEKVKDFCANCICWNQDYKFVVYNRKKKGYLIA